MEKGREVEGAMDLWAARRALVLLIVRRWWGRISAFSSEARDSMSERGMSSSSEASSSSSASTVGPVPLGAVVASAVASSSSRLPSLSLSLSFIREASIYERSSAPRLMVA